MSHGWRLRGCKASYNLLRTMSYVVKKPRGDTLDYRWVVVETRGVEAVEGVIPISALRMTGLEAKGSFKAFISYSKVGRRTLAYCKGVPVRVEEERIWMVFRPVETLEMGGIRVLGGGECYKEWRWGDCKSWELKVSWESVGLVALKVDPFFIVLRCIYRQWLTCKMVLTC